MNRDNINNKNTIEVLKNIIYERANAPAWQIKSSPAKQPGTMIVAGIIIYATHVAAKKYLSFTHIMLRCRPYWLRLRRFSARALQSRPAGCAFQSRWTCRAASRRGDPRSASTRQDQQARGNQSWSNPASRRQRAARPRAAATRHDRQDLKRHS